MNSTRQSKVSRLIQKELADIFQRGTQSQYQGKLITVTTVRVTPDFGLARVHLSFFPSTASKELLDMVQLNAHAIRHELAGRVGKQMRKIPELEFFIDDSLDYVERIEGLLNQ